MSGPAHVHNKETLKSAGSISLNVANFKQKVIQMQGGALAWSLLNLASVWQLHTEQREGRRLRP